MVATEVSKSFGVGRGRGWLGAWVDWPITQLRGKGVERWETKLLRVWDDAAALTFGAGVQGKAGHQALDE